MEPEPTRDDVDALVGPATPHFAYQLRARVGSSSRGFPTDHDVRRYAEREDGAARPARPRLVEGRGGPARVAVAARLGRDPVVGAGRRPAAARERERLRHGRVARDRPRDRARASRATARSASRSATSGTTDAAEETAEELRALGAEPVLVRGNVTSERVLGEVAALGPLDVLVHNAATGVDPPGARDGGQALGLDAERERARAPRARARRRAADAGRLVDRRDLVARRAARARELRRWSGRRRRRSSRSSATSPSSSRRGIRVNAVSGGVVETGALEHFPNREEMLADRRREPGRPARRARTTSPARSRSSARRTPR